jgi:hypothetical protein
MSNVINIIPALDPDAVLQKCIGNFSEVVVCGYDKDGVFDFRAGGKANMAEVLYMLQTAIHKTMNGDYDADDI